MTGDEAEDRWEETIGRQKREIYTSLPRHDLPARPHAAIMHSSGRFEDRRVSLACYIDDPTSTLFRRLLFRHLD